MIDLAQLRREPDAVADALARRGVDRAEVAALVEADAEHRRALQGAEETCAPRSRPCRARSPTPVARATPRAPTR